MPTTRRRLSRATSLALALLALSYPQGSDAFAPRPAMTQMTRGVSTKAPRVADSYPNTGARRLVQMDDVEPELVDNKDMEEQAFVEKKSTNPTPVLFKYFQELSLKNTAFAAVAALAFMLTLNPLPSNAAMSGGRMGGSYSSPSRSLAAPRSYGGGGYSRGFSSGYSAGYYSRPSVVVSPFSSPLASPFVNPFFGPSYYGGPGVITYSRGPGLLPFLFFGAIAFSALSSLSKAGNNIASSASWASDSSNIVSGSALGPGTSVVQVTVGLEVPNRDDPNSILSVLGRLANTARTDSRVGIQNLTSQVALELLRRKSSIVSASTNFKHFNDRSQALRHFNSRSVKERGKFETETVSNFGGLDYGRGNTSGMGGQDKATMAVVTILLSIDGDSTKVPRINSVTDVEDALRKIASDSKVDTCLQSAEILWTPEDRGETLSARDVVADYPELRSV